MSLRSLPVFLLVILPFFLKGQVYSYTHYDIQHGLAGSTVYCMLQDKQGFLWVGTETGVSRFDGVHFKNFTTVDGLPDNQVLQVFEDSKGRIWMAPFNKSVCYYYKGKIYNQQNDSLLKKIRLSGHIVNFAEDKDGNVVMQQVKSLHVLKPDNTLLVFDTSLYNKLPEYVAAGIGPGGRLLVMDRNCLLEFKNDQLVLKESSEFPFINFRYIAIAKGVLVHTESIGRMRMAGRWGDKLVNFWDAWAVTKFNVLNDSEVVLNTQRGAIIYNLLAETQERFLNTEAISTVFRDSENNLWFCTLGHGIYMLNSPHIFNLELKDVHGSKLGVYALARHDGGWVAGSDMTNIFYFDKDTVTNSFIFRDSIPERIVTFWVNDDKTIWAGSDARMIHLSQDLKLIDKINNYVLKDIYWNGKEMLAATGRDAFIFDLHGKGVKEVLWRDRATCIYQQGDSILIGTLDGLYIVSPDRKITDVGQRIRELRYRIMDIDEGDDGTLWIATFSGIYAYKNGNIVATISEKQGLVSNICRAMDIYGNELWVGTNRGLQRIDISNPLNPAPVYTLTSELSSDIINAVCVDSNMVAVGTPEGASVFDKEKISFFSKCDLIIDKITVTGSWIDWDGKPINLAPDNNNIRFEFAGISFRSAGDIRYQYRLVGLDSSWRQTRDNYVSYPTLPAGEYVFQVHAINKFGLKSPMRTVGFFIEKRLWQKTWFQALIVIASMLLTWLLLAWRIRVIRKKGEERNDILKKIAALEQLALKSQMNPHFIFNSLNSIQQYVIDKDVRGANKFISDFSKLIRKTLDMSARPEISLAEELTYLSTYLELEKMRLEGKFTYEVKADDSLVPEDCFIPPMVLQPFVENSVRHGVRYRHDNDGKITVLFRKAGEFLECVIEDNGVGRKASQQYKSANPIEYQSKGISLTTDRIELMNRSGGQQITVNIYDLEDGDGQGTGTRVILSFPLHCN